MKDRTRISITIRPEIVSLLDSRVDGVKLRNRSHAIEQFLKDILFQPVQEAVIFAADESKPLLKLAGKTLIERMLNKLKKSGINKVIICTNNKENELEEFLSKKKDVGMQVVVIKTELNGTAQALLSCRSHIKSDSFLLLYGDIYADLDFVDLIDYHNSHHNLATMVITSTPDPLPWGVVRLKRDRIVDFSEKPIANARLTNLINAGIFILEPEIFSYIDKSTKSLEKEVFPILAKNSKLNAYLLDGAWFDIGTEKQFQSAINYFMS